MKPPDADVRGAGFPFAIAWRSQPRLAALVHERAAETLGPPHYKRMTLRALSIERRLVRWFTRIIDAAEQAQGRKRTDDSSHSDGWPGGAAALAAASAAFADDNVVTIGLIAADDRPVGQHRQAGAGRARSFTFSSTAPVWPARRSP